MLTLLLYFLAALFVVAHMQPVNLIHRLRGLGVGPQLPSPSRPLRGNASTSFSSSAPPAEEHTDDSYNPTPIDILITRILLTKCKKLPADIVDIIFDHAEYWAHSTNEIDYILEHKSALRIVGRSRKEDHFLIRSFPIGLTHLKDREDLTDVLQYDTNETKPRPLHQEHPPAFFSKLADYPTPRLAHPVRKIVFTTKSRDQGMGAARAEKNYKDGWTWFEAGLERFEADQVCDAQCVADARFRSTKSVASKLPMCALRPIYPTFSLSDKYGSAQDDSKEDGPEYKYDHGHLPADERLIQRNQTRCREVKTHVVQWSWTDDIDPESDAAEELKLQGRGRGTGDGSFVRDLKLGDVITVWGKAKFPAWINHVDKVRIDVYWAV